MHIRERGFSPFEIILIVAVIGLLVAVGYLFVQSVNKQDTNKSTETSTTKKTDTANDSKSALENVQAFYKKILDQPDREMYPPSAWVSDGFVTQEAADQYKNATGMDITTCSQNPLSYNKYTFATPTITGSTGMVHITGAYETGGDVMIMTSLVKDGTSWKINKFSCTM